MDAAQSGHTRTLATGDWPRTHSSPEKSEDTPSVAKLDHRAGIDPADWYWLDGVVGPVDADFEPAATEKQAEQLRCLASEFLE